MYVTGPTQLAMCVGKMTQFESTRSSPLPWGRSSSLVDRAGHCVGCEAEHDRAAEHDRELARAAEGEDQRGDDER